jgi:hypothetical protein
MASARRRAISTIVAEGVEALTRRRQTAQRNLVRAVENATDAGDIHRSLLLFAIEASRDYAEQALRADALADELANMAAAED